MDSFEDVDDESSPADVMLSVEAGDLLDCFCKSLALFVTGLFVYKGFLVFVGVVMVTVFCALADLGDFGAAFIELDVTEAPSTID